MKRNVAARILLFAVAVSAAVLAQGTYANAQGNVASGVEARLAAAVQKLAAACRADIGRYCGSVTPGEGRLVYCVLAHQDKVSTKCDYALFDAARKLERALDRIADAADACWDDIEKHCANVPEGGGRIAQCLITKKASLAPTCRTAIDKFPAK